LKILIAYARAGTGHRRAAEALESYLKKNYKQLDVQAADILDYANFLFRDLYSRGYSFIIGKAPFLWKLIYRFTSSGNLRGINRVLGYWVNRLSTKRFRQFLLANNFDVILATHFLPCETAGVLKKDNLINSRLISIVTDFNVHPCWITEGVDEYIAAGEFAVSQLEGFGINKDKIRLSGIPVDLKFSQRLDRRAACEKLGLKQGEFTVLIATAAFGLRPIEKIVDLLRAEVQMLVICGNNNRLLKRLAGNSYPLVKPFGFVENIEELMAASDVIITKPGGLTCSESLAMGLPMIFIAAIYGQETKNARILEDYGVGVSADDLTALRDMVINYKNNPRMLNAVRERISRFAKPFAVKEICECFLPR